MTTAQAWLTDDAWQELPDDPAELFAAVQERGWGDGLPVLPPTEERVRACLDTVAVGPDEVLGFMPVAGAEVTAAKVAANAVLAGCPAAAFPVVLTAITAMLRPEFNLTGLQATTHPVAPLLIVHGPIAGELGMNWGSGAFGPGNLLNATIGRAVRLCCMNLGHARPGRGDRATQGQPSKYSYCVAENAEDSPWEPYHVSQGLSADTSAVTVYGAENPHNVNDHVNDDAKGLLGTVALTLANAGCNNVHYTQGEFFVVLGPEHAASIAASGFTREDVQLWLYDHARLPLRALRDRNMWNGRQWPAWMDADADDDPDRRMPVVRAPHALRLLVVGGPGKHSCVIPGFGETHSITQPLVGLA
jgi:hypothetical protein